MSQKSHQDRVRYLEYILGTPFTTGNKVRVLKNGDQIFPAMLRRIREAKHSVFLLTYVYWSGPIADEFADALAQKGREGLDVRVILDSYGASDMPERLLKLMKDAGIKVCWYQPMKTYKLWRVDHRTHRKVLVCDNKYAFTGGVGIAAEWEGDARNPQEWRDTHFEIEGAAVPAISGAFWHNWFEIRPHQIAEFQIGAQPQPRPGVAEIQVVRSAAAGSSSDAENVMKSIIHLTHRSLRIATPYFVPDDFFLELLCRKARAGVDITLLVPGPYLDKRFERWAGREKFDLLLNSGVRLFRYQRTMIHCKIILVDEELCCIGTANFNRRSLGKDDELLLNVFDAETAAALKQHFDEDLELSEQATDSSWRHRNMVSRIGETLTRPFRTEL